MFKNKINEFLAQYPKLILYDNICGMCQYSVQMIIKYNNKEDIYFAALDSDIGRSLKAHFKLEGHDSIIFIEDQKAYFYSKAIFKVAKYLKAPINFIYPLFYLPGGLTALPYRVMAKYRKKFIKTPTHCPLYPLNIRKRFLDGIKLDY